MIKNKLQIRKQINWITQIHEIYIYSLISKSVWIEKFIYYRQNQCGYLLQLILNSNIIKITFIKHEKNNNEYNKKTWNWIKKTKDWTKFFFEKFDNWRNMKIKTINHKIILPQIWFQK